MQMCVLKTLAQHRHYHITKENHMLFYQSSKPYFFFADVEEKCIGEKNPPRQIQSEPMKIPEHMVKTITDMGYSQKEATMALSATVNLVS